MPQTINQKRTAQRTRKGAHGRNNKAGKGCQGGSRTKEKASGIIANSIFALTLKPRPSLEVVDKIGRTSRSYYSDTDDYYQMYEDLFAAYKVGVKICTGEATYMDPLKEDFGIGFALAYLMNGFKSNILPKGFEFNVDRGNDGYYYFTIYACTPFAEYWHGFDIRPVVHKLRKENKPLHDLFIVFLRSFMAKLNIPGWWNGGMGYAEYQLMEELQNWDEYNGDHWDEAGKKEGEDNAAFHQAQFDYHSYTSGEAKEYQQLIEKAKPRSAESLLQSLGKFDKRIKIVRWMKNACELMKEPYRIEDFEYAEMMDEGEGLEFNQQVTIIWDWDDNYTRQQSLSIDATAQGCGVYPPVISLAVTPVSKKIDIEWLKKGVAWPGKITALQKEYISITEKLTKRKGNE